MNYPPLTTKNSHSQQKSATQNLKRTLCTNRQGATEIWQKLNWQLKIASIFISLFLFGTFGQAQLPMSTCEDFLNSPFVPFTCMDSSLFNPPPTTLGGIIAGGQPDCNLVTLGGFEFPSGVDNFNLITPCNTINPTNPVAWVSSSGILNAVYLDPNGNWNGPVSPDIIRYGTTGYWGTIQSPDCIPINSNFLHLTSAEDNFALIGFPNTGWGSGQNNGYHESIAQMLNTPMVQGDWYVLKNIVSYGFLNGLPPTTISQIQIFMDNVGNICNLTNQTGPGQTNGLFNPSANANIIFQNINPGGWQSFVSPPFQANDNHNAIFISDFNVGILPPGQLVSTISNFIDNLAVIPIAANPISSFANVIGVNAAQDGLPLASCGTPVRIDFTINLDFPGPNTTPVTVNLNFSQPGIQIIDNMIFESDFDANGSFTFPVGTLTNQPQTITVWVTGPVTGTGNAANSVWITTNNNDNQGCLAFPVGACFHVAPNATVNWVTDQCTGCAHFNVVSNTANPNVGPVGPMNIVWDITALGLTNQNAVPVCLANNFGTYSLDYVITDFNGCVVAGSANVQFLPNNGNQPQTFVVNDQFCPEDSYTLPNGIPVTQPGSYFDFIPSLTNPGCFDIQITNLTLLPQPTGFISTECSCPMLIQDDGVGIVPASIQWWDAGEQNLLGIGWTQCALPLGEVNVLFTGVNGCQNEIEFNNEILTATVQTLPWDVDQGNMTAFANLVNNSDNVFLADITFDADVQNLNIANAIFRMGPNTKIVLKPGAEVNFLGCLLVACDQQWDGIYAQSSGGINPIGQFSTLNMTSCRIRHMRNGINIKSSDLASNNSNTFLGANIELTLVDFLNNRIALDINRINLAAHETNTLVPRFNDCSFIVDNDYFNHFPTFDALPNIMVKSFFQLGYSFDKCTFSNDITAFPAGFANSMSWNARGRAIDATRGAFRVTNGYAPGNPPHFSGFETAIYGFGSRLIITGHIFERNARAVQFNNSTVFTVRDNWIEVGNPTGIAALDVPGQFPAYEGIVCIKSKGFTITGNIIAGHYPDMSPTEQTSIGIRVRDSETADDEIYKNILRSLTIGNLANGTNTSGSPISGSGLRYVCNFNNNNHRDFLNANFNFPSFTTPTIANIQWDAPSGLSLGSAAGNEFTTGGLSPVVDHQFGNNGLFLTYRWSSGLNLPLVNYNPLAINSENYDQSPNSCASLPPGMILEGGSVDASAKAALEAAEEMLYAERQTAKYLYLALLDDGDTESLQAEVDFAWSNDTWEMRERLLDISPFVSKTVLIDVANRTDVFPHPVAFEIFAANPDVLRDSRFMDYLADKADPMPEYLIALLLAARNQTTFRTAIQHNLDEKTAAHVSTCWTLAEVAAHLNNRADRKAILSRVETLATEMDVAELDWEDGEVAAALARMADVPQRMRLDEAATHDWEQYSAWLNFKLTAWNDSTEWAGLDSLQLAFVYDMADRFYTRSGVEAMHVLNTYYGEQYFIPPALGQDWTPRFAHLTVQKEVVENGVKVYPNPADAWVMFEMKEQPAEASTLVLRDPMGRHLSTRQWPAATTLFTLDTRDFTSGTYFYEVQTPDKPTEHGKLIITH